MEFSRLSPRDRIRYAGSTRQVYGVQKFECAEGPEKGTALYEVSTGGALSYQVLPDNGLDIYGLTYRGVNVSYQSRMGLTRDFNPMEDEFTRLYAGGLLYTCGFLNVGPGNRDEGIWHPLHGRAHGLRAQNVSAFSDDMGVYVSGETREAQLFGHNLKLERRISSGVGASSLVIEDVLRNEAAEPIEFMMLYHMNFGYPFLSEDLTMELPAGTKTTPRTAHAAAGLSQCTRFIAPVDGGEEQVYFHDIPAVDGKAGLKLLNARLGFGVEVRATKASLPVMVEWKCMRSGDYALGIEPSNSYINGRSKERENGTLKTLAPFAEERFRVELNFFDL